MVGLTDPKFETIIVKGMDMLKMFDLDLQLKGHRTIWRSKSDILIFFTINDKKLGGTLKDRLCQYPLISVTLKAAS